MRRFCYKCGASEVNGPLIRGICQDCFIKEYRLVKAPNKLEIKLCKRCNAYLLGKEWCALAKGETLAQAVKKIVLPHLRILKIVDDERRLVRPKDVNGLELQIEPLIEKNKGVAKILAFGKSHERQIKPSTEHLCIDLQLKWVTCDVCALKSAGHHEAILQVRGKLDKENASKLKVLLERCVAEMYREDHSSFIARIEEKTDGFDLLVNPLGLAKKMAKMLKTEFGAEIKESAKLIGKERGGRRKFKVSILARLQ